MTLDSIAYTMTPHDRMPGRRSDPQWVAAQRGRPDTQVIPLWRDRCVLASNGQPMRLTGAEGQAAAEVAVQTVLLGMDGPTAVFAADLDHSDEASALRVCGASGSADLRTLAALLPASTCSPASNRPSSPRSRAPIPSLGACWRRSPSGVARTALR